MKIIITGATGSLGAYLTRYYAMRWHEVIAVGRAAEPPAKLLSCATYIQADISNEFKLPDADICIHAAALADDRANENSLYNTNVLGTQHVARAAKKCKLFIHVSSSSVYAPAEEPLTEEMTAEPDALFPYGKSKLLAERTLRGMLFHPSTFILRPRGIYGAGDRVLLPRLLKLVRNDKMIRPGMMNARLSMTHFSNFAHAVDCCIRANRPGFHVYNVADDRTYILFESAKKMLDEIYGRDLAVKQYPLTLIKMLSTLNIGEITPLFLNTITKNMMLDISKIKAELDYRPQAHFDSSLTEVAEWVKNVGGIEAVKRKSTELAWL